ERVRDTPISEAAIAGAAAGAAATGLRPIMEVMFMDFVTISMDGILIGRGLDQYYLMFIH
ncbi:hypothetical protein ACTPEM_24275, partial [Clostridioides difficile]